MEPRIFCDCTAGETPPAVGSRGEEGEEEEDEEEEENEKEEEEFWSFKARRKRRPNRHKPVQPQQTGEEQRRTCTHASPVPDLKRGRVGPQRSREGKQKREASQDARRAG